MPCLKCFISLLGFGHPVFLSRCTFFSCCRAFFVIAIETFLSFVATPSGIGGRLCILLYYPLCYSPYHWTVYTKLACACWWRSGSRVVLFGFWCVSGFLGLPVRYEYYPNESPSLTLHALLELKCTIMPRQRFTSSSYDETEILE